METTQGELRMKWMKPMCGMAIIAALALSTPAYGSMATGEAIYNQSC